MSDNLVSQVLAYRLHDANRIIEALAAHGNRIFYSAQYDLTGYFYVDAHLQGWWVDHRDGMKVEASKAPTLYPEPQSELLTDLLAHIKTGRPIAFSWLDGRLGYTREAMQAVIEELRDCAAIAKSS